MQESSRRAVIAIALALLAPACGAREDLLVAGGEPPSAAPPPGNPPAKPPVCVPAAPWSLLVGGDGSRTLTDLTVGDSGDALATGLTYTSADDVDFHGTGFFVTRLDAAGNVVYERRFSPKGDPACDTGGETWQLHGGCGSFVAPAGGGEAVLAIRFHGELDVGGHEVASPGVVAKLDAKGDVAWSLPIAADNLYVDRPAVDAAGNVILAGDFNGKLKLGAEVIGTASEPRSFLVKLGPDGAIFWKKTLTLGNVVEEPSAVAVFAGASGEALLVGQLYKTQADFGAGPVTSPEKWLGYFAKYDATGALVTTRIFAASEVMPAPGGVTFDPSLGIVLSWDHVEALDTSGAELWSTPVQVATGEYLFGAQPAVDAAGNIAVVYADSFPDTDGVAVLVASYDHTGTLTGLAHVTDWETGPNEDLGHPSIAFDACGDLRIGSTLQGTVSFGQGTLEAPPTPVESDYPALAAFVARVAH